LANAKDDLAIAISVSARSSPDKINGTYIFHIGLKIPLFFKTLLNNSHCFMLFIFAFELPFRKTYYVFHNYTQKTLLVM